MWQDQQGIHGEACMRTSAMDILVLPLCQKIGSRPHTPAPSLVRMWTFYPLSDASLSTGPPSSWDEMEFGSEASAAKALGR